jgi:hypothetical protein
VGLTDDEIDAKLNLVLKGQAEEAKRRKLALTVTIVGAVFAAGRLGILAVPFIKARRG